MKTLFLLTAALVIGTDALNLDKVKPPENRIVNGVEASTTDVPYQVGLYVNGFNTTTGGRCGGALISEKVVLTAAHCFKNKQLNGKTYLGTNRYKKGTIVSFSRVTVHNEYNTTTKNNDIALVHLDKAVEPNGSTIKLIKLDKTPLADNTEVIVSGYGLIGDKKKSDKLFYTQMTIRNKKECSSFSIPIVASMACAEGENGKETCPGDSGGPVVKNWPNNPTHVALVSFGKGCQKNRPKVFMRTASYVDWIERNMK